LGGARNTSVIQIPLVINIIIEFENDLLSRPDTI
jgi:hypothetical protein